MFRRLFGTPRTPNPNEVEVLPKKNLGKQVAFRTRNIRPLAQQVDELGRELINAINMKNEKEVDKIIQTAQHGGDRVLSLVVNYNVPPIITPLSAAIKILDSKNSKTLSILITLLGNGATDTDNKGKDALAKCFIELIRTTEYEYAPSDLITKMTAAHILNYVVNAKITYKNDPQYTALKAAAARGNEIMVNELLNAGAEINTGKDINLTALTYLLDGDRSYDSEGRGRMSGEDTEDRTEIAAKLINKGAAYDIPYTIKDGIETMIRDKIIYEYKNNHSWVWGKVMKAMCTNRKNRTEMIEACDPKDSFWKNSRRGGRRTRKHKKRSKKTRRVKRRVH